MKNPKEIGGILKEAREKRGLNFDKIWRATRIQSKIVEAIEEGRAEEILNRVYAVLFLKKYAFFLNLDGEGLAKEYKAFYAVPEKQIIDISKKSRTAKINIRKLSLFLLSFALVVVFMFSVTLLGAKLKSFYKTRKLRPAPVASRIKTPEKPKTDAVKIKEKIFPIPKSKPVSIALESADDVWVRIRDDKKVMFEGTLKKNEKKDWSTNNNMKLWVGRAEALDFIINGVSIGKIGEGNIKNIELSREGLKIGKKWLIKAER